MKRAFGLLAVLALLSNSVAQAGIANSKHDLVNGDGEITLNIARAGREVVIRIVR